MPDKDFLRVLLLLTVFAAYMLKMGKGVALLMPNSTHVTCMAYAAHRVSETIRAKFPAVDRLVSSCKRSSQRRLAGEVISRSFTPRSSFLQSR